jgi:FkbM family methyltransferase
MKFRLLSSAVSNWWTYYLLRRGLFSSGTLKVKSRPDRLSIALNRSEMKKAEGVLRFLFQRIREGTFEYSASTNEMVVYSSDRTKQAKCRFHQSYVESVQYCVENDLVFEECEEDRFFIITVGVHRFYVRKSCVSDAMILKMTHLDHEYDFLRQYLQGSVVLDIGANIGDTAVLFAGYGARKVVAYEPHPDLYRQAQDNLRLNRVDQVVSILNAGVGATNDTLTIREDSLQGATAGFGLREAPFGKAIPVRIIGIADVMKEIGSVDVVKMDCEGAEFDILEAISLEDLRRIRVLGVEYHRDPQAISAKLEHSGFSVQIVRVINADMGLLLAIRNDV